MNFSFKRCFSLVVIPLPILLSGCNSDGSSSAPPTVFEISVAPSSVGLLNGREQQLLAMAKYDDGSEHNVSDSVAWEVVGDPTIANVTTSGLLKSKAAGHTELTATKDGIVSNTVNVNVCADLTGACIDIIDTGGGKLITSSPSVAYLDSIGGSPTNTTYAADSSGTIYDLPAGSELDASISDFYLFNWVNANALCDTYNTKILNGRTNWRLATFDEYKMDGVLISIVNAWPGGVYSWTSTPNDIDGRRYDMSPGSDSEINFRGLVSCTSELI